MHNIKHSVHNCHSSHSTEIYLKLNVKQVRLSFTRPDDHAVNIITFSLVPLGLSSKNRSVYYHELCFDSQYDSGPESPGVSLGGPRSQGCIMINLLSRDGTYHHL